MNIENTDIAVVLLSVVVGIVADITYYHGLKSPGHTAPNRWSWAIWSFSAYIEVATFKGISDDWLKVIPLATTPIACTLILWKIWRLNENRWESSLDKIIDMSSVVLSLGAIIILISFSAELWAHAVMICAVPISYIPQWKDTLKSKSFSERDHLPWLLWTVMDALNIVLNLRRLDNLAEIPYVAVEFICHGSVWVLISFRRSA
jgi:hypothetical protein